MAAASSVVTLSPSSTQHSPSIFRPQSLSNILFFHLFKLRPYALRLRASRRPAPKVVCTLGSVVFVSILLVRGVWTGISYFQQGRTNGFDDGNQAWNGTQPVA